MPPPRYYEIVVNSKDKFNLRLNLVKWAQEKGVSVAARDFRVSRRTVYKWLRRYEAGGAKGLLDRSHAPKHIPHKVSGDLEARILALRDRYPSFGARRLKMQFDLPCSAGAIHRVLVSNGRIKPRRKKSHRRRDLRELKARLKSLELVEVDVKHLNDILEFYPTWHRLKLPKYQYSARDVKTGAVWIGFAYQANLTTSCSFIGYLAANFREAGIDLEKISIQTDNGSEFIGSWNSKEESIFARKVKKLGFASYHRIPPLPAAGRQELRLIRQRRISLGLITPRSKAFTV